MKIKATVAGYGPQPGKTNAFVDVSVDFEASRELATFRVLVPDGDGKGDARELAVARARDLARKFVAGPRNESSSGRNPGAPARRAAVQEGIRRGRPCRS